MTQEERDAVACYILSKQQGAEMIAILLAKPVDEVRRMIREGERLLQEREE